MSVHAHRALHSDQKPQSAGHGARHEGLDGGCQANELHPLSHPPLSCTHPPARLMRTFPCPSVSDSHNLLRKSQIVYTCTCNCSMIPTHVPLGVLALLAGPSADMQQIVEFAVSPKTAAFG